MIIGSHTIKMYEQAEKVSRPYLEGAVQSGQAAWQEGGKQLRDGAKKISIPALPEGTVVKLDNVAEDS